MSTKTNLKRIAAVAALALALGGLSSLAAQASAVTTATLNGATTNTSVSLTPTVSTFTNLSLAAGTNDSVYTIMTSGVGSVFYPGTAPAGSTLQASGNSEIWSNGTGSLGSTPGATVGSAFSTNSTLTFSAFSQSAGVETITVYGSNNGVADPALTYTLTWGAAPTVSAANSFVAANNAADIAAGTVGTTAGTLKVNSASADTGITVVGNTPNVLAGGAVVGLYNNAATPGAVTTDTISASVAGSGIVTISNASFSGAPAVSGNVTLSGTSVAGRYVVTSSATQFAVVKLYSDGTSGKSTVTITDATTGTVIGTFTVMFYSTNVASLVATTNYSVPLGVSAGVLGGFTAKATAGFTGSTGVLSSTLEPVTVVAKDSSGNVIPSVAGISVTSGTPSVATVSSTALWDSVNSVYYPVITPVAVGSTVLTFTDTATGLVVAKTTVNVASTVVSSVTGSSDAASYGPGVKVTYILTAKDSAGNAVADGSYSDLIATAPSVNFAVSGSALPGVSSAVAGTPAGSTGPIAFVGGVNNSSLYAPISSADVVISGGLLGAGSDVAVASHGAKISEVDFTVVNPADTAANAATAAANEATDAANAAVDAAKAAGDSADAALAAAQDAGGKASAALAAVTALTQQVTTLLAKIAAISVTLAKISAAVAKLAKK